MKDFKIILFPVDLSSASVRIVPYVKSLAGRYNARIHLLFVARVFDYFTSMYVPHPSVSQFEKEVLEGRKSGCTSSPTRVSRNSPAPKPKWSPGTPPMKS